MSGFYKYAQAEPEFVAVVDPDGTEHTAGELLGRANRYVHVLRSLGLEKGDSVAAVLPNGVKPVEVYLAALQAGWYYVPINYRLSAPEIAYIIKDSGAKAIVSDERYASVISAAADEAGIPAEGRLAHGEVPGFRSVEAALAEASDALPEDRAAGAAMHYTSGTTGKPKGVKRKLNDVDPDVMAELFTGFFSLFGIPHREDQVHLCTSPNYHTAVTTFAGNALNSGPSGRVHGQVGPGRDARQDRALLGHPHPHGADPVPPDAAAPRGREVQVRPVLDALGHPRRGAVPHRREAEDARLVGPRDLGVLRRHGGRGHDRHPRGLAQVPGNGRQPVGHLRAEDHRRRRPPGRCRGSGHRLDEDGWSGLRVQGRQVQDRREPRCRRVLHRR